MHLLFILSIIGNLLLILFYIGKRYHYSYGAGAVRSSTGMDWGTLYNKCRTDLFNLLPVGPQDIVFVGDSQIEGFPIVEMFPRLPVKNRGIGANSSYMVLERIDAIAQPKPRQIFLEFGINDLHYNLPEDRLLENYQLVLQKIKTLSPDTEIIVQSILPTCLDYAVLQPKVLQVNDKLAALCQQSGVVYVDVHSRMYKEGELDPSLTLDGLHLNGKGYAIWQEELNALLQEQGRVEWINNNTYNASGVA